jgi:hypothetical protein
MYQAFTQAMKPPAMATVICLRDTVVFSVVAHEWPALKRLLQFKLARD